MDATAAVVHDEASGRFSIERDGNVASLVYERLDGGLLITHTRVPSPIEGLGLGARLVAACVAYAVDQGLAVRSVCWFADRWLDRHPEQAALVAPAVSSPTAPEG